MSQSCGVFGNVDISSQLTQVLEETEDNDLDEEYSVCSSEEVENGPEQGGASSRLSNIEEENVQESHLYLPADRLYSQSDEQLITSILNDQLGTSENAMTFDVHGTRLNDYSTPSLQSMAFPTLFLYGEGDIIQKSRMIDVNTTLAMKH